MSNNNKRRSLGGRYKTEQIIFIEKMRALAIAEQTDDEETTAKKTAWADDLPPLPPEPKGSEKRVIVIKDRGKAS